VRNNSVLVRCECGRYSRVKRESIVHREGKCYMCLITEGKVKNET
jgi:hypothetical protein